MNPKIKVEGVEAPGKNGQLQSVKYSEHLKQLHGGKKKLDFCYGWFI